MNTTAMLSGVLGVTAVTMVAKAFATPYPSKAATFGLVAAVCFLGAFAGALWVLRGRIGRWSE